MRTELLASRIADVDWIALREDGVLAELRTERDADRGTVGRIVKGRVTRVLPGIQSAFLDIGSDREAFLHVDDLLLPGEASPCATTDDLDGVADDDDLDSETPTTVGRRAPLERGPIQDRIREGRDILVQVVREGIGAKGPRVTCQIALPGRYLVFLPHGTVRAVSRKIGDVEERARLRAALDRLPRGEGGFIVRTAGVGIGDSALLEDAHRLRTRWSEIVDRARDEAAPALLHRELDLLSRALRDAFPGSIEAVVVDDVTRWNRLREVLARTDPDLAARLRLHRGPEPLLDAYGIYEELVKAMRPRVWLPSGGYLVIQSTEALVSIDVNTGKFLGRSRPVETILQTNLEAAAEAARQLRLRDLGGIVVVDFIDMEAETDRRRVVSELEAHLRRDRSRTRIEGLSGLGLVHMTRKRARASLETMFGRPCPCCAGSGRVRGPEIVSAEVLRELRRVFSGLTPTEVTVRVSAEAAPTVRAAIAAAADHLGGDDVTRVIVEADPSMAPDRFDVVAL